MTDRLREVTCRHCGTRQATLLHPAEGGGYTFVCLECGRRNWVSEGEMRESRRIQKHHKNLKALRR
jgi:DNA-directed RNA polymerase subunit RPC12/RpoP